ncbi:hypothetical protein [Streptomyces sp. NPDC049915]|uniref:hypothetical protein n=1 Tax=Streptomyces sp. NPDC049915 TaxID=3155510 RepID=UPI0034294586
MSNAWETGSTPWLRSHQPQTTHGVEPNSVQCMFCGGQSVKRSESDNDQDPGRIELYCDNSVCDAREMVLLVVRDGADAGSRADVRALDLIDDGTLDVHTAFPPEAKLYSPADLMEDDGKEVERRMRKPSSED